MISCSEAVRQLWEYLDNEVGPGERQEVDRHLALCKRCCGEMAFTEALRQLLRSAARPDLPTDVEGHLVGFLDTLEKEKP